MKMISENLISLIIPLKDFIEESRVFNSSNTDLFESSYNKVIKNHNYKISFHNKRNDVNQ